MQGTCNGTALEIVLFLRLFRGSDYSRGNRQIRVECLGNADENV